MLPRDMGFAPRPLAAPRPAVLTVLVLLVAAAEFGLYFPQRGELGFLVSLYASIVSSLPIGITTLIAWGAYLASRHMRRETNSSDLTPVEELVIVQIPTIGRHDVIPALTRVVVSMEREMPAQYRHWRVDVVAEQTSPAKAALEALASENVRVLYVPSLYRTPNGTERKARANQWMNDVRVAEGEARADVWVLQMDDDTGVGPDTPPAIARVIHANPPGVRNTADLAQGVLTYPRP